MDFPPVPPRTFQVPAGSSPGRLDVYLAERVADLSRSRIQSLIRSGKIRVDGHSAKPKHPLAGGEEITIELPPLVDPRPQAESIPLDVVHEDGDLLVLNKPAGMVVHPGAGVHTGTLVNALLHHCNDLSGVGGVARPGIVHRLDRLTTGCIVVAKNDAAHQALSRQLAEKTMSRVYVAWVNGVVPEPEGRIDAPIGRSSRNRTRMAVVHRKGREAATNWRVTIRAPGLTCLECRLESGRTHQIRVHLAHIGYPVVGDREYGLGARNARMLIPPGHPRIIQALAHIERQLLHAWRIRFTHPATGAVMEFEAPLPEDMAAFAEAVLS